MVALLTLIRRYWISLTIFILTLITVLSLRPLDKLPPFPGGDKIHHFIAYAVLMLPTALKKPDYWVIISLGFICWSGIIELLQPYINRYGELQDLLANVLGLVFGWITAELLQKIFLKKSD